MNAVISREVAKEITHGRTPLVPVEYETAVKALSECVTFDETKYWNDKADALAAWAKIYHSNETLIKAKRLKLHAYRRMGELAKEIRPMSHKRGEGVGPGATPGPLSLLMEQGLNKNQSKAATKLAALSEKGFEKILERPLAPSTVAFNLLNIDPHWGEFARLGMTLRSWCRQNDARKFAKTIEDKRTETARQLAQDLSEWLDDFERTLPKAKP